MTDSERTVSRPVVVIPGDFPPLVGRSAHLKQLQEFAEVILYSDRPTTEPIKRDRLQKADILLNSRGAVHFSRDVLQCLPNLRMIAVCGIGYDAIDLNAATEQGIVVSNIPGRTAGVVAEHAFALMLSVSRRIPTMTEQIRQGQWPGDLGLSLLDKQIGIIGTGNIGTRMIELCRGFGLKVAAWSFHPDSEKADRLGFEYVSLPDLLTSSDVISLHCRLTSTSRGMIGSEQLAAMKRGSVLINTARAAIVDTPALAAALSSGHLFGAGIDVYDSEPTAADHPLMHCPNVALTPHSADQTQEGLDLLTLGCVENIRAFLNGSPTNVVNPQVLRTI